jgi:GTP-binding protein Era
LLELYKVEVPHSCAVMIVSFIDKPPNLSVIEANIVVSNVLCSICCRLLRVCSIQVERETQRGIVIGKLGSSLKRLSEKAQAKMESFLGRKVYLKLNVKVNENWRNMDAAINEFGFGDAE